MSLAVHPGQRAGGGGGGDQEEEKEEDQELEITMYFTIMKSDCVDCCKA